MKLYISIIMFFALSFNIFAEDKKVEVKKKKQQLSKK